MPSSVRAPPGRAAVRPDLRLEDRRVGLGRGARLGLRLRDRVARLRLDGIEVRCRYAIALQLRAIRRDRVARLPGRDLVVGPVLARVRARMAAVAVRDRLDERWPV